MATLELETESGNGKEELALARRLGKKYLSIHTFVKSRLRRIAAGRNQHLASATSIHYRAGLSPLSPIHSLPSEILSTIFKWLERECFHSETPLLWIRVNGVCSRWRTVALQTPMLWAGYIPFHPTLAAKFLKRSRGVPLSFVPLSLQRPGPMLPEKLLVWFDTVLPEIHRAKEISVKLRSKSEEIPRIFSAIQNTPMPHLESLAFFKDTSTEEQSVAYKSFIFHPPPSLQHISFHGYGPRIDWEHAIFPNLRHLELENMPYESLPSLEHFLAFLKATPRLEILRIESSIKSIDEAAAQLILPLSDQLKYLKEVSLFIQFYSTLILLRSILLTNETRVDISMSTIDPRNRAETLVLRIHDLIECSPYSVASVKVVSISFLLGTVVSLFRYGDKDKSWITMRTHRFLDVATILETISLTNLEHLELDLSNSVFLHHTERWTTMFSYMTSLRTLEITNMTRSALLLKLLAAPAGISHHPGDANAFLALRRGQSFLLPELREVAIGSHRTRPDHSWEGSERGMFIWTLVQFVGARSIPMVLGLDNGPYRRQLQKMTVIQDPSDPVLDPKTGFGATMIEKLSTSLETFNLLWSDV